MLDSEDGNVSARKIFFCLVVYSVQKDCISIPVLSLSRQWNVRFVNSNYDNIFLVMKLFQNFIIF